MERLTKMGRKMIEINKESEVEETMNKLEKELEANNEKLYTSISIYNYSEKELFIADYHFWHGEADYPSPLLDGSGDGQGIAYSLSGNARDGIKFGYVYADGNDSLSRQFLVALYIPLPHSTTGAKVYVEAGPIGPVDWDVVLVKLDMSKTDQAEYIDPIYTGRTQATVGDKWVSISFWNASLESDDQTYG